MESFKVNHFRTDHPGASFPHFEPVTTTEAESIRRQWAERLRMDARTDSVVLLHRMLNSSQIMDDDAAATDFSLTGLLEREEISPAERVFLNWDRFRTIDRIAVSDLSAFFDYIWYPSADDIEIFDDSFTWMVLIHHSGQVRILRVMADKLE